MDIKGFIFDIKKFAIHDGPGIRTTVFLSGCPLNCWWCHNPESLRDFQFNSENRCQSLGEGISKEYSTEKVLSIIAEDSIFYEESNGGVTFSGGEPLTQAAFLIECLKRCKQNSINTVVDTCGFAPVESFQKIYQYTDLFLYDIKLYDEKLHHMYTGVSNSLIKENLEFLDSVKAKMVIRIPLIPEITDTKENLSQIAEFLLKFNYVDEVELLPYNKLAEDKYRRLNQKPDLGNLQTQSSEKLSELLNFMLNYDLKVSIRG
ncbi:MAG: glycyl-radical enzyme activating protein [Melioribacteraceae bacterium]|nr:glycyl-radical enzyme activating protein [Melioribacteraceae bacterium]